jgi:hypothetical protein
MIWEDFDRQEHGLFGGVIIEKIVPIPLKNKQSLYVIGHFDYSWKPISLFW